MYINKSPLYTYHIEETSLHVPYGGVLSTCTIWRSPLYTYHMEESSLHISYGGVLLWYWKWEESSQLKWWLVSESEEHSQGTKTSRWAPELHSEKRSHIYYQELGIKSQTIWYILHGEMHKNKVFFPSFPHHIPCLRWYNLVQIKLSLDQKHKSISMIPKTK